MSWQSYIDNLKTPDHNGQIPVMEAAICGMQAGKESVWVSTPGLASITTEEIKKLAGDRTSFRQSGPLVAGRKCMLLGDGIDDPNTYSMNLKAAKDVDGNAHSICVGKTLTALVIAQGTKEASGGQLLPKVFSVVKHLRDASM